LADVFPGLGNTIWRTEAPLEVANLLGEIERCDILVVGSPVYKASYTGMLKHLFDLIEMKALISRPVLAFATGKAPAHGRQVESHMRSLFDFFDARIAGNFIYALDQDFEDGLPNGNIKSLVDRAVDEALKSIEG
jgi:FMN reductase